MTTYQECASKIGDHVKEDNGHKHLENGTIPAFQKDLADLQKQDAAMKTHDQEFAAGKAATEKLVSAGMIPSLRIENKQALFVAGATADHRDLVISVGSEKDPHHKVAVMDADGVYWSGKKDEHGNWVKDESSRIGDADQFKTYASKQLGQTVAPEAPRQSAPEPSNFESKAAYDKFLDNMGHVYNKYDLNVLAQCYKNMNRTDRVRILSEVQTYNNNLSYASNSDYISVEERHGNVVVSVGNHDRTICSDPH